jgi:hypothetical protein
MRDCVFLLADGTMEAVFQGFLSRSGCHKSLGTRALNFDPREDILSGINDPRTYTKAHELLRPYQRTHRHAVIVLDNDWEGSPQVEGITDGICANMRASGWRREDFEVIVIDPELENWIWQDSMHVEVAMSYERETISLRLWLQEQGVWAAGAAKPARPKEAFEKVLKRARLPYSSAIHREIAERVSIKHCTDPAFLLLCKSLRRWFPTGELI